MRTWLLITAVWCLLLVGCEEKDNSSDQSESFRGTYRVYDPAFVGEKIDSVTLTVESNLYYRFVHYPFQPGSVVDICNSVGTVEEFGTNFATFIPESIEGSGCDSLRIPHDMFVTDFRSHGDTIYMDRDADTLVYEIRLVMR